MQEEFKKSFGKGGDSEGVASDADRGPSAGDPQRAHASSHSGGSIERCDIADDLNGELEREYRPIWPCTCEYDTSEHGTRKKISNFLKIVLALAASLPYIKSRAEAHSQERKANWGG